MPLQGNFVEFYHKPAKSRNFVPKVGKPQKVGDLTPCQWEKIGKVVNQAKLAILSHSEPLQWKKIGKVANWVKLTIPSHSEPLQREKIGKVVNWAKLAILSHFSGKRLEKL